MKRKWILPSIYLLVVLGMLSALQFGSRCVTVLSQQIPIERQHCIVIDPGHGGIDGGATSCSGVLESKYNLDIAIRLDDLFHLLGYDTKMTRRSDVSIHTQGSTIAQQKVSDLRERVKICNETENGLLISIHQNMYPEANCSGAQIFYPDTPGSRELAKALQEKMRLNLDPENNRTAQQGRGIYLLEELQITGVLVECGFISNPREDALLKTDRYQKQICAVIASAVIDYMTNP